MELLCINRPHLDINISETIRNGYFWQREKFLKFLSTLHKLLFQKFATNTAKVSGHFWKISNKFHVFLIFKGPNEFFWTQMIRKCSPKWIYLVFKSIQIAHKTVVFIQWTLKLHVLRLVLSIVFCKYAISIYILNISSIKVHHQIQEILGNFCSI